MQLSMPATSEASTCGRRRLRVGVLALQGGFAEHVHVLMGLPHLVAAAVEVKTPEQLNPYKDDEGIDALILPGGESTAIALAAERSGLLAPLRDWVRSGRPVWGTCAGMILLCDEAAATKTGGQSLVGGLAVRVRRNAFGSHAASFVERIDSPDLLGPDAPPFSAVFIRAPVIDDVIDPNVAILARARGSNASPSLIVAVRQNNILATAFHPELTNDPRIHIYFLNLALQAINSSNQ